MSRTQEVMERLLEGGHTAQATSMAAGQPPPDASPKMNPLAGEPTSVPQDSTPRSNFGNNVLPAPAIEQATGSVEQEPEPVPDDKYANSRPQETKIVLPDGREMVAVIPHDMSKKDLMGRLIDAGHIADPDKGRKYAWDRAMYEFERTDNITTNAAYFMKSHFPYLLTEYTLNEKGNLEMQLAEDIYGPEFGFMSPQSRREHMQKVDQERLKEKYSKAINEQASMEASGEFDAAGTAGMVGKAIADPAVLAPIGGQVAKAAQGVGAAAKTGAKVGAAWGSVYGASEQLAETGTPMTADELIETGRKVATYGSLGAAGGVVLGPVVPAVRMLGHRLTTSRKDRIMKTHQGRASLAKKYYERLWYKQASGMSKVEAMKAARQEMGMSFNELYQTSKTVKEGGWPPKPDLHATATSPEDAISRLANARYVDNALPMDSSGGLVRSFDSGFRAIASRLRDLNPKMGQRLVDMEGKLMRRIHEYHDQMLPFYKFYKSLNEADQSEMAYFLANSDRANAQALAMRAGDTHAANILRHTFDTLEELGGEMSNVGIKFDSVADYFPRMVKDVDGLMDFFGKNPKLIDDLEKILIKAKGKFDRDLTPVERVKIINRWLEGRKKDTTKSIKSTKERTVTAVQREMLPFYDDPITSLDLHIRDSVSAIERRKFFGKDVMEVNKAGLENVDTSVGRLMDIYGAGMSPKAKSEVKQILVARFGLGEQGGSRRLATLRQGTGGLTLGNPYSATRQLADSFTVMWRYGLLDTLKSMPRAFNETRLGRKTSSSIGAKGSMNADTFGYMMEMMQELDTGGWANLKVRRASEWAYKYGGFKDVDRFGKNVLMQTAYRNHSKLSKTPKGKEQLIKKFGALYEPEDMAQLLDDLSNNKVTDLVKAHISSEVMQIQPLSRSQLPEFYLKHPDGRMLYQFHTWGLMQFDLMRTKVLRDMFSGDATRMRKGSMSLALMFGYVGGGNLAITELQRVMTGKITSVGPGDNAMTEEMFWGFIGNIGMDRYALERMGEREDLTAYWTAIAPPALVIPGSLMYHTVAATGNLIYDTDRPIPGEESDAVRHGRAALKETGVGRIIDLMLLGGAEEYNEKEERKRLFGDIEFDR